jgi:predicted DNA-binding transcriptional regulator YafY
MMAKKMSPWYCLAWNLGGDARVVAPLEAVEYIKKKIEALRLKYG